MDTWEDGQGKSRINEYRQTWRLNDCFKSFDDIVCDSYLGVPSKLLLVANHKHMTLSQKHIDEFREIYKKEHPGKELSEEEARDAGERLVGLFELLFDISREEAARAKRLKDEPRGFALDGTWTCRVCRSSLKDNNGWYDKYGMKCRLCQKALDDGIIPSFIFINDDSFFSLWEMKYYFDLKHQTVKKMIKEGQLVAREIPNGHGGVHEYVFLKKENPHCIRKYNAVRKSYDRNRVKKARAWEKKMKKGLLEKFRGKKAF